MMAYFRFQFHQLLTNRKNLAVIGIALVALICQFVFFPPNTTPVESTNRTGLIPPCGCHQHANLLSLKPRC